MVEYRWASNGPEQKLLEKLIRDGSIEPKDKPKTIYAAHVPFRRVSLNCFRMHLSKTRARLGTECRDACADESTMDEIDELRPLKRHKAEEHEEEYSDDEESDSCVFSNPPCNLAVYNDPETMHEMLVLTLSLPSGVNKIKFEVSKNGRFGLVGYNWPIIMAKVDNIFKEEIDSKKIANYHPMIMALKKQLQTHTDVISDLPQSTIRINFPINVKWSPNQVIKTVVRCPETGALVLVAKMEAASDTFATTRDSTTLSNFNFCGFSFEREVNSIL
ncbi:hypothetical protein AC1031_019531 [Aphanomyces cochlioides]|nr:hypothetical protein AC1031_019531 [Aphanomyces cochlioides]